MFCCNTRNIVASAILLLANWRLVINLEEPWQQLLPLEDFFCPVTHLEVKHFIKPKCVCFAETVLFWKWKMLKFYTVSTLCQFFYFMNSRYTTIQGRKILISRTFLLQVFKGNNYLKKYGTSCCNILTYYLMKWIFAAHLTWHMRKYGTNIARIAL